MASVGRLFMDLTSSKIYGETTDEEFIGQIELDSWEWDLTRMRQEPGQYQPQNRPEPSIFQFTKRMDKASMKMLTNLTPKSKIDARVTLVPSMKSSDLKFRLTVELKRVHVVDYSVNGSDEEKGGKVGEAWTFNYDEITFIHVTERGANGLGNTFTSNPIKRSADAKTSRPDVVNEVVDGFKNLKKQIDKEEAAKKMCADANDLFKKFVK